MAQKKLSKIHRIVLQIKKRAKKIPSGNFEGSKYTKPLHHILFHKISPTVYHNLSYLKLFTYLFNCHICAVIAKQNFKDEEQAVSCIWNNTVINDTMSMLMIFIRAALADYTRDRDSVINDFTMFIIDQISIV